MKYAYWMDSLFRIDCGKRIQACKLAGSAEAIYHASEKQLLSMHLFDPKELAYVREKQKSEDPSKKWDDFQSAHMDFIPYSDPRYPSKLQPIAHPPFALYVKGKLPDESQKSIAVVGARSCSEYGRSIAKKLSELLAKYHVQVISGLALGIDSASHAGALNGGGRTFAVLGCGCDICYPSASRNLYRNIPDADGGILSEFSPGVMPLPRFFPQRNRIISALSDVVVIVEAKEKSGSLITADFALEQGKDVYAVPGRFMEPLSLGCNRLIEQGAGILYNFDSFLKNTGIISETSKKVTMPQKLALEKDELMVYSCLDLNPKYIDLIIEETGLNLLTVLHSLECLRRKKLVQETFQNYFCRKL